MDAIVEAALKAVGSINEGGGSIANRVAADHEPSPGEMRGTMRSASGDGGMIIPSLKSSGYLGSDDQPEGTALNPRAQLGLFAKIRKSTSWARFVTFAPVTENSGSLDIWSDEGFKMYPTASEGPRTGIPMHRPDIDQKEFNTRTMSGAFGLRLKAIKSAAKAGQNVNELVRRGVATGIANVLMDLGINGDTDLPNDNATNKQRRTVDGWFKKLRDSSANYTSQADGFAYHNRIWPGMVQQVADTYRADKGLAWLMPDSMGTRWLTELTAMESSPSNTHPSIVNDLGSTLLNAMGAQANPLGKPGIVCPQIGTTQYGTEGYAGVAPTSLVNNGDGTLTINVNTLLGSGVNGSSSGTKGQRYVVVGRSSTGIEETIAVDYSAPNNTVTTSSLLGQTVVSTTAADYYVRYADMTTLFLGVLRYLTCIIQNGIRIYTIFYPRDEVVEIIVHADIDFLVVDDPATSLVDSIVSPRFNILA